MEGFFLAVTGQLMINSIVAGSMYALAAVGFTLIFGVLRLAHFAHGDVAIVGAYVSMAVLSLIGGVATTGKLAVALSLAALVCAVLGIVIDRTTYRPLRDAPPLQLLIAAIAVSRLLQSLIQIVFGTEIEMFQLPAFESWQWAGVFITPVQAAIFGVTAVAVTGLYLLVHRSQLGAEIRAVADSLELARTQGIRVERIVGAVLAIGSALGAVAGVMLGMEVNVHPTMGFVLVLKAFAAVVLGGIGSIPGAIIGAYVIGFAENIGAWYTSGLWKETIAYVVLLLMLLVKPSGLFGESSNEDVKL